MLSTFNGSAALARERYPSLRVVAGLARATARRHNPYKLPWKLHLFNIDQRSRRASGRAGPGLDGPPLWLLTKGTFHWRTIASSSSKSCCEALRRCTVRRLPGTEDLSRALSKAVMAFLLRPDCK